MHAAGPNAAVDPGRPYDTLRNALADAPHSLVAAAESGIARSPLNDGGGIDLDALDAALRARRRRRSFVQRSRGYAPRRSLSMARCERAYDASSAPRRHVAVLVDNCYGELVEEREPLDVPAPT